MNTALVSLSAIHTVFEMQCQQKQYPWRPGYQDYHDFTGSTLDYPFEKYVSYWTVFQLKYIGNIYTVTYVFRTVSALILFFIFKLSVIN